MHYLINSWLERSGMLPNNAPWCDLYAFKNVSMALTYLCFLEM